MGQGAIETLILTYFIVLKFLYQVDMKTVVKCPLESLCYSPTSMTYSEGLIKSSSHENYLLLKILDQWNKFPILVLTFLYGSIFETLHFLKLCPILSSSYGSQCKSNQQVSWSNVLAHTYILLVVLHKCGHAKPYLVVNVINGRKRANHVQTRSSLVQTDWLDLWFCKFYLPSPSSAFEANRTQRPVS